MGARWHLPSLPLAIALVGGVALTEWPMLVERLCAIRDALSAPVGREGGA